MAAVSALPLRNLAGPLLCVGASRTFAGLRLAALQIVPQCPGEALLARAFFGHPGVFVHIGEKAENGAGGKGGCNLAIS